MDNQISTFKPLDAPNAKLHPNEVKLGMNAVAVTLGILAVIVIVIPAILPVVGAIFAWIGLGIGVFGLIFGLLSNRTNGRNICLVACGLALLRIIIFGGLI